MYRPNRPYFVALLGAVVSLVANDVTTFAQKEPTMQVAPMIKDPPMELGAALAASPKMRDEKVDEILAERQGLIKSLIGLVDPKAPQKYDDGTRAAAAYLLGEMRAVEASALLATALSDEPGAKAVLDISRYDFPVRNALIKIGRPAIPFLIDNVKRSPDDRLRRDSLRVLNSILGGKRRLLELLTTLRERAKSDEERGRLDDALNWVRERFKEDSEPLF